MGGARVNGDRGTFGFSPEGGDDVLPPALVSAFDAGGRGRLRCGRFSGETEGAEREDQEHGYSRAHQGDVHVDPPSLVWSMEEWYTGASVGQWGQGVNSGRVGFTPHPRNGGLGHVCTPYRCHSLKSRLAGRS